MYMYVNVYIVLLCTGYYYDDLVEEQLILSSRGRPVEVRTGRYMYMVHVYIHVHVYCVHGTTCMYM